MLIIHNFELNYNTSTKIYIVWNMGDDLSTSRLLDALAPQYELREEKQKTAISFCEIEGHDHV